VAARRDHHPRQLAILHEQQVGKFLRRPRGQRDVRFSRGGEAGYFRRAVLEEVDFDLRIARHEAAQRVRQDVARERERGGEGQAATVAFPELARHGLDFVELAQHHVRDGDDAPRRLGHLHDAVAIADEEVHAEFFLEQADLLADAGLGSVQCAGGPRKAESLPRDFAQVAKLVEFHADLPGGCPSQVYPLVIDNNNSFLVGYKSGW
jgi:hypothetical protein